MVAVHQPLHEKLTLLWHNHFATSAEKVRSAADLATQNQKLRAQSLGDFRTLAYSMLTDPAMMLWLDAQTSTANSPNENLAREFMELFALGHGNGYTEDDVRQGARALTGWAIRPTTGQAVMVPGATTTLPRRYSGSLVTLTPLASATPCWPSRNRRSTWPGGCGSSWRLTLDRHRRRWRALCARMGRGATWGR